MKGLRLSSTGFSSGFTGLAHRGGSLEAFENSLTAFQHAYDLGYRVFETDVQVSRDGTIYIFHDDDLGRVTTATGQFIEMSDDELSRISLNNGEPIPTLKEALSRFADVVFNIDVKADNGIIPMANFLNLGDYQNRICLASFSTKRLRSVKKRLNKPHAMSSGQADILRLFLGSFGLPMGRPQVVAAQVPMAAYGLKIITPRFIRHCHKLGIAVHVWTIDDDAMMTDLISLGVDGIVTDRPSLLKEIAIAAKVWR